jgi:hypothetical protein
MKMKKKVAKTVTVYWFHLPVNLKNIFKAYCSLRGKNMAETIIKFMKDTVENAKV